MTRRRALGPRRSADSPAPGSSPWSSPVARHRPGISVTVNTWSSDAGHGYVGVQANGNWAPPASTPSKVRTEFFSQWQNMGNPSAFCHDWWVTVHRTADGTIVNSASPVTLVRCGPEPVDRGIAVGRGDLSLYLAVAVDPVTAPARTRPDGDGRAHGWLARLDRRCDQRVHPPEFGSGPELDRRLRRWDNAGRSQAMRSCPIGW